MPPPPKLSHILMQLLLWRECCHVPSSCFGGSKIKVGSTEKEMIRGCIATVSYSTPNPISIHLASVLELLKAHMHTYIYFTSSLFIFLPIIALALSFSSTTHGIICLQAKMCLLPIQPFEHLLPSYSEVIWIPVQYFYFPLVCLSYLPILSIPLSLLPPWTLPQLTAQQSTSQIYCITAPNDKVIPWIPKWCIWCQCSQGYSGI